MKKQLILLFSLILLLLAQSNVFATVHLSEEDFLNSRSLNLYNNQTQAENFSTVFRTSDDKFVSINQYYKNDQTYLGFDYDSRKNYETGKHNFSRLIGSYLFKNGLFFSGGLQNYSSLISNKPSYFLYDYSLGYRYNLPNGYLALSATLGNESNNVDTQSFKNLDLDLLYHFQNAVFFGQVKALGENPFDLYFSYMTEMFNNFILLSELHYIDNSNSVPTSKDPFFTFVNDLTWNLTKNLSLGEQFTFSQATNSSLILSKNIVGISYKFGAFQPGIEYYTDAAPDSTSLNRDKFTLTSRYLFNQYSIISLRYNFKSSTFLSDSLTVGYEYYF